MTIDEFTDAELTKELIRRKDDRIRKERIQRENRSNFLFNSLIELEALIGLNRHEDERLINFIQEVRQDGYWGINYDVELRLVKYPPLD